MTTPTLGRAIRHAWRLDPDFVTVNHGSFGATPECVLAEQDMWRRRMEAQPTRFMGTVLPGALRDSAARLAAFVGARGEDIAFVDNATSGCNAVLRSLSLRAGDEVLVLDHGYGAVRNTVRFVTEQAGARMTEATLPFPNVTADGILNAVVSALGPRTCLAVIDHITSGSALVVPLERIVTACHDAGVPVLVDGAHGPGQVDVDLQTLGADWYTGNCHKWLCAPKGCAFLWTSEPRQADTHPTVISHGFGQGYLQEFDWTGTRDPSAFLSIGAALDFHAQLGGRALRQRNIDLAAEAASHVARRLNTETIDSDCNGAMRLVRLPVNPDTTAASVRARLIAKGTDAPVHSIGGGLWLRLSAFAYNELEDYARLADIVAGVLPGVTGMTVEFIGMIHHRQASEIHPPPPVVLDRGYIREFAQAAEAGGFDRVLVGYFADGPDGFLVAAAAAAHTERLSFLLAHRPGYVSPTLAARKFATLDQITDGRAAMHVITGGDDADQFRDGDTLSKDERYERTDEYVGILKRIWTEPGPTVDHEGKYYRFKGASTAIRCVQEPRIPIYFGGASDAALRVSAKHADVYALWGETHAQVREITARLRTEAARLGRTLRFSLSFRPILAPTEDEAWARAERIKQRISELRAKAGLATREPPNEGSRRLLAAAAMGERLDKRLWTGAALATGARGNTTSLVGTPEQVAEALCDYYDLGVSTFLIRGFDPLEDNIEYGRHLLPLTKKLIAERDAARAAAE